MPKKTNLSREPYKGTRDFYPEDEFIQQYMFSKMRAVAELYGYVPYNASLLEESELYRSKSSEEIVNEQTYTFTDRGGREVTLRPEMTPTLARMIARRRKELAFPLRWYSIPNVFRYERPQRGRLREHWQLNIDLFGTGGAEADAEVLSIADNIMKAFGAKSEDYGILINNRVLLRAALGDSLRLDEAGFRKLLRTIDRREKMLPAEFDRELNNCLKESIDKKTVENFLSSSSVDDLPKEIADSEGGKEISGLVKALARRGIKNVSFSPTLVRGFDYYTGNIFEVFDMSPENNRALFGGGRYDTLLSLFGVEDVPAVGFGLGDVTMRDFLETHKLLPEYRSSALVYLCRIGEVSPKYTDRVADYLRARGIPTAVDLTGRKIGMQIKTALKQNIPYVVCLGEEEEKTGILVFKELDSEKERRISQSEIADFVVKKHGMKTI